MLSSNVGCHGLDGPVPEQLHLNAGPLSLIYEGGDLRYITLGDREIIRRIYVAVRDPNWLTIAPVLSNVSLDLSKESFSISFDVENKQNEIDFFWHGRLSGDARGTIRCEMDGIARSTFLRNRIGFCLLHPVRECAGQPCRVEHADGSVQESTFPYHISAHQPFANIRAISHQALPGVLAEVRFEGDVFEMEDQRNWTDGSFKTYSTPLSLPFPVEIKQGARISQSVTLSLNTAAPVVAKTVEKTVHLSVGETVVCRLPQIGLGRASHGQALSHREISRLKAMHLGHLRVDLSLEDPGWIATLEQANAESQAMCVPLLAALLVSQHVEREINNLLAVLARVKPQVKAWLVFPATTRSTTAEQAATARQILQRYDDSIPIGGGTNCYFTELNRFRPPAEGLDIVSFSVHPTEHASDNASLVENLEAQAWAVASASQFCHSPVAVGPVLLRRRFNPYSTRPEPAPVAGELPPQVDVRQMSLFGAAWTVGSLAYLAPSGAASLTYYETTGWRGVMETESGSPLPEVFRSLPGAVYPLYHVLVDVCDFRGGDVLRVQSSQPLKAMALALQKAAHQRVLVTNLTAMSQVIRVDGLGSQVRLRWIDATNAEGAMQSPEEFRLQAGALMAADGGALTLALLPHSVACLDSILT